jgi:hypothetical protein
LSPQPNAIITTPSNISSILPPKFIIAKAYQAQEKNWPSAIR